MSNTVRSVPIESENIQTLPNTVKVILYTRYIISQYTFALFQKRIIILEGKIK